MNPETLRQLVANCRKSSGRSIGRPHEWTPHRVEIPGLPGFFFSDAGAWDLIADKLDEGIEYQEISLDTPYGSTAIVLCVGIDPKRPPVYMKVQVGNGSCAIGRSFHYSHYQ